jgi:hypothetical protein
MNSLPEKAAELYDLLGHLCNDNLTIDGFQRLIELLSDDPDAQKFYVSYTDMNESMRHMAVTLDHQDLLADLQAKLTELLALSEPSRFVETTDSRDADRGTPAARFEIQAMDVPKDARLVSRRDSKDAKSRREQSFQARLVIFLSGSVLAGAVVFQLARTGLFASVQPGAPEVSPSAMPAVAYMTSTNGCDWSGAAPWVRAAGNSVQVGDEIALNGGIAEFRLETGVYLSVEGPAGLVLTSPNSLVLQYGKITAQVPWPNRDYRILAGACRLETADGEFGVWVTGGRTDIHVFSGEVIASNTLRTVSDDSQADEDSSKPLVTSRKEFTRGVISQGCAIGIDNRRNVMRVTHSGDADPSLFATKLSMAGPLPVSKAYIDRILADRPKAYWRFESEKNRVISNEVPGGDTLSMVGNVHLVELAGNRVAELPPGVDCYLFSHAAMDALANSDYSFEVWIKPSHVHYGTILGLCTSEPTTAFGNAFLLEVQSLHPQPGRADFGHPNSIRFLHRDPPAQNARLGTNCFSSDPYTVRRWQHVVAVKRGSQMELYIDGNLDATATDQSSLAAGQRLVIGRQALSVDKSLQFIGQLDEVAVYARALTPQEIRAHYKMIDWTLAKKRLSDRNTS